jgi:O-antigen/teichoic acid export membrane protein
MRSFAPSAGAAHDTPMVQLWRLIAGQTTLMFAGFATAQGCAFLRNAIFAHVLSRGDFGIAAIILITLQLVETLTDLGSDRLIIQAEDGASAKVVGTAQAFQMARGIAAALLIALTAYPLATFYGVPDAGHAFMAVALVPLLKSALNLDMRRAQRVLDNRPYMAIEVAPQVLSLMATPVAIYLLPTYDAVILIVLIQAAATVAVSHLVASEPWRVVFDWDTAKRMLVFSWPIWATALPLIAVYQGDRVLIGRLLDMEAVAGYSAAFLITMVPGVIVAKVANALCLPLLSDCRSNGAQFLSRYRITLFASCAIALVYAAGYALLGGPVLAIAFGPNYADLGTVVALLALMWAMRMVQAVPGMAIMAFAQNRALLETSCLRALALIPAYFAISNGFGIVGVAAVAVVAEACSLTYAMLRLRGILRAAFPGEFRQSAAQTARAA